MLRAENISFSVDKKTLLQETSISFAPAQFHVIMGANGAGKSTLLKILAGHLKPSTGNVFFENKKIESYSKTELAKKRAVLSQHYHIAFPIKVQDIVQMGRYPYYSQRPSAHDTDLCHQSLQSMQVAHLADRDYQTLSGGEAQKVQMSRVLAQIGDTSGDEEKLLFLDEPVSHLDIKYQQQLLQVAHDLCRKNVTVIAVLHDINLALSFAHRILFMKEGAVVAEVTDAATLSPALLQEVFDVQTQVLQLPHHSKPIIIF